MDIISVRISQPVKHLAASVFCETAFRCGNKIITGRHILSYHRTHSFPDFVRQSIHFQNLLRSPYNSSSVRDIKQSVCDRGKQFSFTSVLSSGACHKHNPLINQPSDNLHILPVNSQSPILYQSSIYIWSNQFNHMNKKSFLYKFILKILFVIVISPFYNKYK